MIESMPRDAIDWLVPLGVCVVLSTATALVGAALEWSGETIGTVAIVPLLITLAIRFWIHDYEAEEQRERDTLREILSD